jgi:TldD protein
VVSGGHAAYAYTNELTMPAMLELADAVRQASAGGTVLPGRTIDLRRKHPRADFPIEQAPETVSTDRKADLVLRANRTAGAVDPRIRQATVMYRENRQHVLIANSDGFLAEDERLYLTAFVQVVASDGGVVQTGYDAIGGLTGMELFDRTSFESVAETAARRAVMMLSARKAPAGRMPVVLSSAAGGTMIHEAVGHGLEADLAQSGLSVYSGKRGQPIASPLITVDRSKLSKPWLVAETMDHPTSSSCSWVTRTAPEGRTAIRG